MAKFNNKNGHWITTKDGRRVFIEDGAENKAPSSTKAKEQGQQGKAHLSALSKRRAEKRANDILAKYPFTDTRKADDIDAKGLRDALQQFYEKNNGSAVGHTIEDKDGALYIDGEMTHQFDISDTLNRRIGRTTPKEGEPDYEAKQLAKQDNEAEDKLAKDRASYLSKTLGADVSEDDVKESDPVYAKKVEEAVQGRIINEYADDILSGKWEHRGGTHGWGIQHGDENELVAYMADNQWRLKHIGKDTTMMLEQPVKTDKFLVFSEAMKDAARQAKQANASPKVKQALDTLDKVLEIYTNEGTDVLTAGFYTDFLKLVQEQKDEILRTMK